MLPSVPGSMLQLQRGRGAGAALRRLWAMDAGRRLELCPDVRSVARCCTYTTSASVASGAAATATAQRESTSRARANGASVPPPAFSDCYKGYRYTLTESSASHGLFGISELQKPEDFAGVARHVARQINNVVTRLVSAPQTSAEETLRSFDDMSRVICALSDPASLCRAVHPDPEWQRCASDALVAMESVCTALNLHTELDAVLRAVATDTARFSRLSAEDQYALERFLSDSNKFGVNLPKEQRDVISGIQDRLVQLGYEFGDNVQRVHTMVRPVLSAAQYGAVEDFMRHAFTPNSTGGYEMKLDVGLVTHLLYSPDRDVRRQAYATIGTQAHRNIGVVEEMRQLRYQWATMLGYESYAAQTMQNFMAQSPAEVLAFLETLSEQCMKLVRAECAGLGSLPEAAALGGADGLQAYDWRYLAHERDGALEANRAAEHGDIGRFFQIESCMEGLDFVCRQLYGVRMVPVDIGANESWHPTVSKYMLVEENGDPIGLIYFDLFARTGKAHGSAKYSILFPTADLYPLKAAPSDDGAVDSVPRVAVVCDFRMNTVDSSLQLNELRVLFHEFGHALHALFSRTQYQHTAGTRGAIDFIEMPSTLMEKFVGRHDVLSQFARDARTGEVIPRAALDAHATSNATGSSFQEQLQIMQAIFDQRVHGPVEAGVGVTDLWQQTFTAHSAFPYVPGTHTFTTLHHLVHYAGGYYTYMLSKVMSNAIWNRNFASDPLSRDVGEQFRSRVLRYGGGKDPRSLLSSALGYEDGVDVPLDQMVPFDGAFADIMGNNVPH